MILWWLMMMMFTHLAPVGLSAKTQSSHNQGERCLMWFLSSSSSSTTSSSFWSTVFFPTTLYSFVPRNHKHLRHHYINYNHQQLTVPKQDQTPHRWPSHNRYRYTAGHLYLGSFLSISYVIIPHINVDIAFNHLISSLAFILRPIAVSQIISRAQCVT